MPQGLIVGAILVAVLACPIMMWLGRRGIGPGCGTSACSTKRTAGESLDELRRRERQIADRIAQLEAGDGEPETGAGAPAGTARAD